MQEEAYASQYSKNSLSVQDCGAHQMMYGEDADGMYMEEHYGEMGAMYWKYKNAGSFAFTTGWRVYESADDATPYVHATGGETTYSLADHGFTDTTPAPEEDMDDDMEEEMGAAALMATATALAAFLVF